MQDRFQFRVWDKYTHETPAEQMQFLCFNGCLVDSDGCHHSPDDYIVEQCTGLKDKNGKLIFEGDIVKIGNGSVNGEVIESEFAVEWVDKIGRYNLPTWTSDVPDWSHYVEIIGNIHETKEETK